MGHVTRLFVGNLPDNLDENALRDAFSSYGNITNFDLKSKPGIDNDKKQFAFITISTSNFNIESCIKHFSDVNFQGNKLHVTRARESFLERLQREREQSQKSDTQEQKEAYVPERHQRNERQNFNKRKFIEDDYSEELSLIHKPKEILPIKPKNVPVLVKQISETDDKINDSFKNDKKKQNSDQKRLESMKKKRQEFNEKKNIIKSGLISIDKKTNKKIVFSDTEDQPNTDNVILNGQNKQIKNKPNLFDEEASDDDINFEIKEQFEGKKGQEVLNLQSRYKSDKRFILDQRFTEEASDNEEMEEDQVEIGQADEKSTQLNILQDFLGIPIRSKSNDNANKTKPKLGMLRFDPSQPEHAKYLAPVENKEPVKKSKKKKSKDKAAIEEEIQKPKPIVEKVEISKEQFYKISDTLKEAITQPHEFSLRSLFTSTNVPDEDKKNEEEDYVPIASKKDSKVRNPLDTSEKNPFIYDSSDSENEDENKQDKQEVAAVPSETKTVWREKLFFSSNDNRLKDGLLFFGKTNQSEGQKERRELKSLMKKRIYNKERKNTMFQKKIGGRKKTMKKKFKKS